MNRWMLIAVCVAGVATSTGCDTGALVRPEEITASIRDDVPPPDPICRSGYIIIDGRTVCADSLETTGQSTAPIDTSTSGSSDGAD